VVFAAIQLEGKREMEVLKRRKADFEATRALKIQKMETTIHEREEEARVLSTIVHRLLETERGNNNNNNEQTDPHNDNHESDQDDDEESSNDGEPDNIKNYQQYGKKVRRP